MQLKIAGMLCCCLWPQGNLWAQSNILKQGHRGCRGLMPENTIEAMKKALDLGVHVLELDVVISKDKQVIVSHDPYLSAAITLKPSGDTVSAEEQKRLSCIPCLIPKYGGLMWAVSTMFSLHASKTSRLIFHCFPS
jgi:glycerophosphoryl diester phosphodiesterase